MNDAPRPTERRPNRAMSATGPEITVTGTPLGPHRPVRHTLRQVGWLGQTGAFYDLDEKPSLTERGGFAPLYFIAHSDEIDIDAQDVDDLVAIAEQYELGCVTLDTASVRDVLTQLADAQAELHALKDCRPCGRSATHPPHKWMTGRKVFQCAGVGDYDRIDVSYG